MAAGLDISLIAGLGNPGTKYEHSRHNMGVDLLMMFACHYGINLTPDSKFSGLTATALIEGQEIHLLFPTTFMNESGRSVGALCRFYRIEPKRVLILHDELDLIPGQIRLKFGGGLAGHNGLKSIYSHFGNDSDFWRLRIGIGKAPYDTLSHVLGRPAPKEKELIKEALDCALEGLICLLGEGPEKAMQKINGFKAANI